MKRRLGESCALENDGGGSRDVIGRDVQIRRSRSSEPLHSWICFRDSLHQQQQHRSRYDIESDLTTIDSEMDSFSQLKPKATVVRRNRIVGLRTKITLASIFALGISSLSMSSAVIISSTTAKEYAYAPSISVDHGLDRRNLQDDIQQCMIALAVGDTNRDDVLSKSEYLRFVNQLASKIWNDGNNDYVALSFFDDLSQSLKENYDYFSDPELGQINILGSKPGQVATSEQDTHIAELCDFTSKKIRDPNFDLIDNNDPITPDDNIPITGKDCSPTIDRGKCNQDLSISDSNQNDLINEFEFVKFVNRLSGNQFANISFGQLPLNIKDNYYRFATKDGQVDVSGSKPGQRVSVEQDRFLNTFCCETELAVENPGISITEEPAATPAPTLDFFFCQRSMASSDLDRNDGLNEEEYVIFLNRLTNNQYVGQTYDTLDAILQENFVSLIGNNDKIDIFGSKPGQAANVEEENYLVKICKETGTALNGGVLPTKAATTTPITSSPSVKPSLKISYPPFPSPQISNPPQPQTPEFSPGRSEAYNSFLISNRGGMTAANLTAGTLSRNGLDEAYGIFVEKAVEDFSRVNGLVEVRSLRRRKLAVNFLPESDEIYRIVDSNCPEGLSSIEICQTAFAKFQLALDEEDAQLFSDLYTNFTQDLISEGKLQVILKEVDERTILKIIDASYPVTPQVEEITKAPAPAPNDDEIKEKKKLAGPIVGGIIFVMLLSAIIWYVSTKGLPFELPSLPNRAGARVGNKVDEDDDAEVGLGFGRNEDDISTGEKNSFGKDFGNENRIPLADDDDDGDGDGVNDGDGFEDEDDGDETEKNRFGFRSKTKSDDELNGDFGLDTGLDSKRDLNDNYAFEEPSEINSETENGSVAENEDIGFAGKPESSNWGTNDVFDSGPSNQGWGANGGEENFFPTPTFGEGQEEKEESIESGSYSSEDETYESGEVDENEERSEQDSATDDVEEAEQEDSYSGSSADDSYKSASLTSAKMSSDLRMKNEDMDAAIDNGDWDAVVAAANAFDKGEQESSMAGSSKKTPLDGDDEDIEVDSYSDSYSGSGDGSATTETTTSEDGRKRAEYRAQVEELVQIVLPDETEKVDAMMDQFKGREAELVSTLQTMEERSSNQRARAAIHKSMPRSSQKNSVYSMGATNGNGTQGGEGSTAGTAAIAAASLPIPAEGVFNDEAQNDDFDGDFEHENAFGEEGEDQYEAEGSEHSNEFDDQSYYSEEDDNGSASFYSEEEQSASNYSEGSQEQSVYSQEEGSQQQSFYSQEEGSQQRSVHSQEGESIAESYYSDEGSQSEYSGEESYVSGEEGSFYSEEGSANDQQ